jgi:hypothetical protein
MRLIKLHFDPAWHFEVSYQAVAVIGDLVDKFHAPRLQLGDGLVNVVAIKRDVV